MDCLLELEVVFVYLTTKKKLKTCKDALTRHTRRRALCPEGSIGFFFHLLRGGEEKPISGRAEQTLQKQNKEIKALSHPVTGIYHA